MDFIDLFHCHAFPERMHFTNFLRIASFDWLRLSINLGLSHHLPKRSLRCFESGILSFVLILFCFTTLSKYFSASCTVLCLLTSTIYLGLLPNLSLTNP